MKKCIYFAALLAFCLVVFSQTNREPKQEQVKNKTVLMKYDTTYKKYGGYEYRIVKLRQKTYIPCP